MNTDNTNNIADHTDYYFDNVKKSNLFFDGIAVVLFCYLFVLFKCLDLVVRLYWFLQKTDPIELFVALWSVAAIGLFVAGLVLLLVN